MRQRGPRIPFVEGEIGEYVAGIGDAAVATARCTALRQQGNRPCTFEIATVPGSPRGKADRGGEQRMVGACRIERPLRPTGGLIADAQVHKLGQRHDEPHCKVDVSVGHGVLERGSQVVVVGQHPQHPRPLVGSVHTGGSLLRKLGVMGRMSHSDAMLNAGSSCRRSRP